VLFLIGSILFIKSSEYTLVSHTLILANAGGVLIIILNLFKGILVHRLEIFGTVFVIGFSFLFINDSKSSKSIGETNIIFGDFLALLSMPFYVYYIIYNTEILKKLPAMIILHLVNIVQLILYFIYLVATTDTDAFLSADPVQGMFGWASSEYLLVSIIFVGPIAGILGVGSYIFMNNFFPSHVVASIFLLEPL
jgi:drug/metabolite transporter (DMT)-like permease